MEEVDSRQLKAESEREIATESQGSQRLTAQAKSEKSWRVEARSQIDEVDGTMRNHK